MTIKTKKELYLSSPLSLPSSFQTENYRKAFDKPDLSHTFVNTFFYTLVSVLILALLCGMTAWAMGISFGVFLMNSFMTTVPIELEEEARIDGCSIFRTYFSVVMPLLWRFNLCFRRNPAIILRLWPLL